MITTPVIRYHGGKFRLASWILQHFPEHRVYVEPFGGAAGVLMQKPRSFAEVYNDLDGDIVNLFQVLQDAGQRDQLTELLVLTPYARSEFERAFDETNDPIEQARRTIIRAEMGFGSAGATKGRTGFRIDTKREYATAQHIWARFPDRIAAIWQRLAGVLIEQRPAIEVMQAHDTPDTPHVWTDSASAGWHWRRPHENPTHPAQPRPATALRYLRPTPQPGRPPTLLPQTPTDRPAAPQAGGPMTARKHSIQKRRNKMTEILLRTVAIVHHSALGYGEVRTVDMKLERVSLLDRHQAGAIAEWAHPWCVFMAVMTDDKRMHTAVVNLSSPMVQADLTPTLEEEHQRLLAKVKIEIGLEGNGVQVHSFGWIAMPRQQDVEDEKAERLFAAALRTMRRAAA